ncbi:MAG: CBS domain-containing protein [Gammaproteobacteria bacterium]|nr:CBS domain-containing protein [Gammaproteobacteria bacterium]
MKLRPQLKSFMTPFPYSIDHNSDLSRAVELMEEHDVRHLPVTGNGGLIGVITDRDINAAWSVVDGVEKDKLKVKDVYVSDAYIANLNEPLDNVLITMAERHIDSVLVTRKGKLVGVFTHTDACRSFGEYIRRRLPFGSGGDAA